MKLRRFAVALFAAAAFAWPAVSLIDRAPADAAAVHNPFEGDENARRAGAKLYARECGACHGLDRQGIGKNPPLLLDEIREAPAGALFWVLRNGSLRRGMPSFAHLPEPQRWQIVTFLRSTGGSEHPQPSAVR